MCAKTCLKKYQNLLEKVIIVSVSERAIGFGGLMKVSFSQHRRRPNPKVWNMDCGAAAYHDVSYLFGFLALEGTGQSIWHFNRSQKLILVGSQEVHKVIILFQFQKAVSLIITESKW